VTYQAGCEAEQDIAEGDDVHGRLRLAAWLVGEVVQAGQEALGLTPARHFGMQHRSSAKSINFSAVTD
jgi:hypothetical protein